MSTGGISGTGRLELAAVMSGGRRVVTPDDVVETLAVDAPAAAKKLARWCEQGWLRRARRGLYVPVPVDASDAGSWTEDPWVLAEAVWAPCCFTGWTSAGYWSLTDQMFRTTVVKTSGRVRRAQNRLLDHDYLVGHLASEHLTWGLAPVWRGERRVLVADPGRTVIDVLDDPALIGGARHAAEVVASYLSDHPAATLLEYGDRLGNRTVFKRLGYIASRARLDVDGLVAACADRISAGVALLDPSGARTGPRDASWGLRVNATIEADDVS